MKIYTAYFAHESNSFSPIPTSLQSYRDACLYRPATGEGSELLDGDLSNDLAIIPISRSRGHDVHVGPLAATTPSAPTRRDHYELLRDEIIASLQMAMPVDAVLLFMHGAQLAMGYDDCGGDILRRIRALVGPDIPIGIELDLHCNISPEMVELADVIIACKEYPHTDFENEAGRLVSIIERVAGGECAPEMIFVPVPILGYFHTTREPMRSLVDEAIKLEKEDGILSVSICHGFGLADSPHTAAGILVVGDHDHRKAMRIARDLADRLFSVRDAIKAPVCSITQAIEAIGRHQAGTLVIADVTDNPGGGAAGDSTFLLRRMIEQGVTDAAISLLWDPEVVDLATKAGVGTRLAMRLGGKTGPASGDVLDVMATVTAVRHDAVQKMFGSMTPLGAAVALDIGGITVVVNSIRQQVFHPRCFTEFGIDPWALKLLVVKAAHHFYAEFAPFAERILYVDAPGTTTDDFSTLRYTKLARPIWPIDQPPFEAYGRKWGHDE